MCSCKANILPMYIQKGLFFHVGYVDSKIKCYTRLVWKDITWVDFPIAITWMSPYINWNEGSFLLMWLRHPSLAFWIRPYGYSVILLSLTGFHVRLLFLSFGHRRNQMLGRRNLWSYSNQSLVTYSLSVPVNGRINLFCGCLKSFQQ